MPGEFFHGVAEDELLRLSRLILEGRGTVEAWDLHALLAAVERARISRARPFRLFNDLMASGLDCAGGEARVLPGVARVFARSRALPGTRRSRSGRHSRAMPISCCRSR